jgi:hypothetical protein
MLKTTAAAAAVSSLLIAAAPADAKTFRGKTNQGRTASLVTGADGLPTRVRVAWRAPCKRHGYRAVGATRFVAPYTSVSADEVTDRDKTYRVELDGGLRGRITVDLVVKRSGDRWTGTLGVRELFGRKGRVTDVCEVKRVRFTLS